MDAAVLFFIFSAIDLGLILSKNSKIIPLKSSFEKKDALKEALFRRLSLRKIVVICLFKIFFFSIISLNSILLSIFSLKTLLMFFPFASSFKMHK